MLDRKLLLVSGKGGVGKSAVAASLAIRASRLGKRVLAIGLVDHLGLSSHLSAEDLGYVPHEVKPGIFTLTVDRTRVLDEYLRLQLRVPRSAPTRQFRKLFQLLVNTAPGVREIISIGKPVHEVWLEGYDLVVVDAPPLGQLFSYLAAPATIADLVPTGAVRDQAIAIRDTLANPETSGLVLVATAEELPVTETLEAVAQLQAEPLIASLGVAVNRVLADLPIPVGVVSGLDDGPARDAAMLHQQVHESQQRWIGKLPRGPQLPYLFGLLTPGEIAARLADVWDGYS